jgi:chromosome segregation ATPase
MDRLEGLQRNIVDIKESLQSRDTALQSQLATLKKLVETISTSSDTQNVLQTENQMLHNQMDGLTIQLENIRYVLQEYKTQRDKVNDVFEEELMRRKEKIEMLEAEIRLLKGQLETLQANLEQNERDIQAQKEKNVKNNTKIISRLNIRKDGYIRLIVSLQQHIASKERQEEQCAESLNIALRERNDAMAEANAAKTQNALLQREVDEMKRNVTNSDSQRVAMEKERDEAREQTAQTEEELANTQRQLEEANKKATDCESHIATIEKEREETKEQRTQTGEEMANLQRQLDEVKRQLAEEETKRRIAEEKAEEAWSGEHCNEELESLHAKYNELLQKHKDCEHAEPNQSSTRKQNGYVYVTDITRGITKDGGSEKVLRLMQQTINDERINLTPALLKKLREAMKLLIEFYFGQVPYEKAKQTFNAIMKNEEYGKLFYPLLKIQHDAIIVTKSTNLSKEDLKIFVQALYQYLVVDRTRKLYGGTRKRSTKLFSRSQTRRVRV